jgi:hypothetical protein
MRAMKLSMSAAMVAVLVAGEAAAQSCTGVPTNDRQLAVMGDLALTDGVTGYGAGVSANLVGPWSVSGGYMLMDYEGAGPSGNGIDAKAAYEVKLSKLPRLSVCPTAGVEYGWVSEAGEKLSSTIIPVGVGFGKNVVDGSSFDMLVYGVPHFMHVRTHIESQALGTDETVSDNAFGGKLGGRFVSNRIFGGASVSFNTLDGSEPVWGLTVGYIFGGNRQPVQASRSKAAGTKSSAKSPAKAPAKSSAKGSTKTAPRKN